MFKLINHHNTCWQVGRSEGATISLFYKLYESNTFPYQNREGLDTIAATDDNKDDKCVSDEEFEKFNAEVDFSRSPGCHCINTCEKNQGFVNDN